jgi:hypothetical protein
LNPITPSLYVGALGTVLKTLENGLPQWTALETNPRVLLPVFATYAGAFYAFQALQCPMVAYSNGEKLYHPAVSGAMVGFVGVHSGRLPLFFFPSYFFNLYPRIKPAFAGALIYGGLAAASEVLLASIPGREQLQGSERSH